MSNQRYTDALLANGKLREERDRLREALEHIAAGDFAELAAENERLREALAWMENLDPELVEAAIQKFSLAKAET